MVAGAKMIVGKTRIARTGVSTQFADLSCTAGTGFNINVSANSGAITMSTDGGTTGMVTLNGSGNVGIGTSSPSVKLQVTGTIKVATGNAQGILSLGDGSGATTTSADAAIFCVVIFGN